eukprot:261992_1
MATGTRRLLPNLKLQRFRVPVVLFGGLVASRGFVTTEGFIRSCGATAAMSVTTGCGLSKGEGLSNEPQTRCILSGEKGKVRHVVSTLVTRNWETLDHSSDSLLLKRSKGVNTFPERWALVSGSVEPGESFAQAAIRELEEETGWIVGETADLLWEGKPLFIPAEKGHGGHAYCVHPFRVQLRPDIRQPDPKIDWEHTTFQWVPFSRVISLISELDHVPYLQETVQSILFPPSAEGGLLHIRNDRSRGASELQLETISIMRLTCEEFCATNSSTLSWNGLRKQLLSVAWPLIHLRQNMHSSMCQGVLLFMKHLDNVQKISDTEVPTEFHAKDAQFLAEQEFMEASESMSSLFALEMKKLKKRNIGKLSILTHSRSGSVCLALKALMSTMTPDNTLKVYVMESRPLLEGVTQINELQEFCGNSTCKCEFEIITDAYCATVVKECDAVVIGADTVTQDGSIVNKVGSLVVALAAKRYNTPLVVLVDKSKGEGSHLIVEFEASDPEEVMRCFSMYNQHGNAGIQVRNVMFEEVPGDLITKFITPSGIVEPHNMKEIISGVYDEINTLFSNEAEDCGTM